ncbi:formylmethanofuran dehydrogenase subunit C [Beggiatoa leptomitoformis]|uniref:Formylmethanofuran dehydrogenase subunit C n=1 Tax=Beggiatoa leptomitoformis TaxID=288004 RepID=A0A2N9YGI7_9GAMM|nr:formylmethanofuran dehydrogenase subunit C [Beggiatoa leptomitoformis]ALG68086.1 formylmethanofuran dehydrogenase subunit C [Beggiatoa leptomitoformis]AUI69620.1 formylmethanofuran dehydrogenase subunit C [Beggiatoa leptomitoformis]
MNPLTFTLKTSLQQRLDLSALTPSTLQDKSLSDINALELPYGNRLLRVDAVFDVVGDDAQQIIFNADCNKLDHIGAGLTGGTIEIQGSVGAYLGRDMRQGTIKVFGNTDVYAAAGMRGGEIFIQGNAGDFLGAARASERQGMRGGRVIVTGNAGHRVGDQLRRGIIVIEGDAGDYCASRMIAGTIAVFGQAGRYLGYGMQRGTVVLSRPPAHLPATFNDCGKHELLFLRLLGKSLQYPNCRIPSTLFSAPVQRFAGDLATIGKGEILVAG